MIPPNKNSRSGVRGGRLRSHLVHIDFGQHHGRGAIVEKADSVFLPLVKEEAVSLWLNLNLNHLCSN